MTYPKTAILFLSLALVACAPLAAHAQPPGPPPQADGTRDNPFDVEARVRELQQRLGLDATQATRVRAILEAARGRFQALRAGGAAPGDDAFRFQRRQILWDAEDQIWALLSCPQKDAFRLYLRERMAEHMDHHRRGPGGPGGPGGHHGRGRRG